MRGTVLIVLFVLLGAAGFAVAEQPWYNLPKLPVPPLYGTLLMDTKSTENGTSAVVFSHWRHRLEYTCRVCHFELEFEMKAGATDISEERNQNGELCGACHDGVIAFGHTEANCGRCHTGNIQSGSGKFRRVYRRLPKDSFGNRVDWSKALRRGVIKPKQSLFDDNYSPMPFKKTLLLEAEYSMIPPAVFPHESHTAWLDCANCHPYVFNIKKKTTKHFLMDYILEGRFCGACHLNVAFPLDDCTKCHPGIKIGR